jgi:hypothetical protein
MSLYEVFLVTFLTSAVILLTAAWWTGREPRIPLARLADPTPLPGERASERGYGPWPVDTGPLLIVSETTATGVALEREIRQRCAEAERLFGRVDEP